MDNESVGTGKSEQTSKNGKMRGNLIVFGSSGTSCFVLTRTPMSMSSASPRFFFVVQVVVWHKEKLNNKKKLRNQKRSLWTVVHGWVEIDGRIGLMNAKDDRLSFFHQRSDHCPKRCERTKRKKRVVNMANIEENAGTNTAMFSLSLIIRVPRGCGG